MGTRKWILLISSLIRIVGVAGACLLLSVAGGLGDDPAGLPSVEPVQGPGEPPRIPEPFPAPFPILELALYLQSVSPFASVPQLAPVTLTVPRNTELTLSVMSNVPVDDFVWTGAEEISQTRSSSTAKVSFTSREQGWKSLLKGFSPKAHVITVTPVIKGIGPLKEKSKSISVSMSRDDARDIEVILTDPAGSPIIGHAGKVFLCHARTIPSGYEPLIEWTGGGSPSSGHGAEFSTTYLSKGSYTVHAGPASRADVRKSLGKTGAKNAVKFEIYEITSISRESSFGQIVWYGYPITFRATTDPPGYEGGIPWLVDTHDHAYGTSADPEEGTGSTFTTTFRSLDDTDRFWAQVYAGRAEALDEQDEPPDPRLELTLTLQSVPPFTRKAHVAPETLRVPRGTEAILSATSNLPVDHFVWTGAEEESHDKTSSTARVVLADVGQAGDADAKPYTVTVTPVPRLEPFAAKSRSITFLVTRDDARDIAVMITEPTGAPMIGHAGKNFVCHARTSPSGYEDLIEWTGGGSPPSGGGPEFSTTYLSKGHYALEASLMSPAEPSSGGPSAPQIEFQIYDISSIFRQSPFGQTVWYGFPITFTATTDPPGFDEYIPWRVYTHDHAWGTAADPETGTGPSFTTTFYSLDGTDRLWAQVYAGEEEALTQTDPPPPAHTFTVNSVGDGGDTNPGDGICNATGAVCTLRAAIQESNASPGPDTIQFNIGAGTPTIAPLTPLPVITEGVFILGDTGGATRIELNGASAGAGADGLNLSSTAGGSTVRAMVVNRFGGVGIRVQGASNIVQNCYLGTDSTGTGTVTGNGTGALLTGSSATGNTIGGTTSALRNVISHNSGPGLVIRRGASNCSVLGNYVGLAANGTTGLANGGDGLLISDSDGTSTAATQGNLIGGSDPAARNVISGNTGDGVKITGPMATCNTVAGNYLGPDATGSFAESPTGVPNTNGMSIGNGSSLNNIGQSLTPTFSFSCAPSCTVAACGNKISSNSGAGIRIADSTSIQNTIRKNSIFSNGALGIDLGPVGVTPNDNQDPDTGANNLQNFPVITSATGGTIMGTLNSTPSTTFTMDVYSNSAADPSGNGEGQTYLTSTTCTTNGSGDCSWSLSASTVGPFITATATDPNGNTSEFSAAFASTP